MPTVLRVGPYRFFFFSGDRDEPPRIHVERDENHAKFWLDPVRLEESSGFTAKDVNRIQSLIEENAVLLLRSWHEFFNG